MGSVLSLDQGTTSSRALIFSETGELQGIAQQEFQQHYRQPGWVEHDPEELWESQLASARSVLSGVDDVACVGITNQRETTVVWDRRTGKPLCNALVWMSTHTESICAELEQARGAGLADALARAGDEHALAREGEHGGDAHARSSKMT